MSESNEHRNLIISMSIHIALKFPGSIITTDIQDRPGDPIPDLIDGFRPDIYAENGDRKSYIVGEAKTAQDLENTHSNSQLCSFANYLEDKEIGTLLLGISGEKADRAKTLLRFLYRELNITHTKFQIFDGLDFWTLNGKDENQWLLD